jgi:hypothetical protein
MITIAGGILLALLAIACLPLFVALIGLLLPFAAVGIFIYFAVTEPSGTFVIVLFMAAQIFCLRAWEKRRASKRASLSVIGISPPETQRDA